MDIPAEQQHTAALLQRLAGRPAKPAQISALFIGDDTVWKLRKAVHLPFVDFSTIANRRRAALRELELNAPHAPGLYRDVVPVIRRPDATLALGGDGEAVDWVVRMARVPDQDFLPAIVARNGLTPALLDAMADSVAAYHAALPPLHKDPVALLRHIIEGNCRSAARAGMDPAPVRLWRDAALATLEAQSGWLRAREQDGFIRRCHGDLHLGNLCLWQGRPVPFDALEFDEALGEIDLGYDLAFLLMDLDVRAGRASANRVMNRYLARTGQYGVLRGLPLFLSIRAMIRAHVAAGSAQPEGSRTYLDLALACLPPPPVLPPMVLAIGGLPATGKSTLARALAPERGPAPGALVLRSDEIRKRQHGVAPEVRLPQSAYTASASRAVFDELAQAAAAAAAAGHAVIADATFMDPDHRDQIEQAAGTAHFIGAWLQVPMSELETRIAARSGDASDANLAVLRRAARADPGPGKWISVAAADGSAALARIRAALDR